MLCYKKARIICSLIIISACGFQPVFKKGAKSILESEMRYIEISPIADRIGQKLRNLLVHEITPLGESGAAKYRLTVTLKETKQNLAIKKSEVATRANLHFVATYRMNIKSTGRLLIKGNSQMITSFNILTETFSTTVAEENARARAVREISADIGVKIAVFFRTNKDWRGVP
jgi:LPS-assembly lipoprotein